jgi:hypothetical protein
MPIPEPLRESLISRKAFFENLATKIDPMKPLGEDEWSLAQVIEHLVITEKALMLAMMRAKTPMPERDSATVATLEKYAEVLKEGTKYDVPNSAVLPSDMPDLLATLADWQALRTKLFDLFESPKFPGADILVFAHPIGGPMNALETVTFLDFHLAYHQIRVESLLATV